MTAHVGPGARIAVMIASDHPIMRDGLRLRIQQEADMWVACEASDLTHILREFRLCRPDVVIIDLHLPRDAGVRAMSSIRAISARTPLVLLANYMEEPHEARHTGDSATVIVSKVRASELIIPAIREAIASRL